MISLSSYSRHVLARQSTPTQERLGLFVDCFGVRLLITNFTFTFFTFTLKIAKKILSDLWELAP